MVAGAQPRLRLPIALQIGHLHEVDPRCRYRPANLDGVADRKTFCVRNRKLARAGGDVSVRDFRFVRREVRCLRFARSADGDAVMRLAGQLECRSTRTAAATAEHDAAGGYRESVRTTEHAGCQQHCPSMR